MPATVATETTRQGLFTSTRWTMVLDAGESQTPPDDALNALPVAWRECLILREVEALSYKEIARIMDIPIGTVMSRLSRARQALQREVFAEGALPGNPSTRNIRADIG